MLDQHLDNLLEASQKTRELPTQTGQVTGRNLRLPGQFVGLPHEGALGVLHILHPGVEDLDGIAQRDESPLDVIAHRGSFAAQAPVPLARRGGDSRQTGGDSRQTYAFLQVEDNGAGMDGREVAALLQTPPESRSSIPRRLTID